MIKSVIFDLGGVLIDWNPGYLYKKLFHKEEELEWFLKNVCTPEWNEKQDAGRSFADGTKELLTKFPQYEHAIRAWYDRWPETIGGPIHETVDILKSVRNANRHRLFALTNWSAETFPWARQKFDFLQWFEGIVVSGEEKTRKPFPEFYEILLERYGVASEEAIFIDDNLKNVEAARRLGLHGIHFQGANGLRVDLRKSGVVI